MVLIGYLGLIGAILWLLRGNRHAWIQGTRPPVALAVRAGASSMTVLLALLGAILVVRRPEVDFLRIALGTALIGGSFLYSYGVALWRGKGAYWLRLVGWCLVALALSVPSTLTPALLVVALMVVVLVEVPVTRTAPSLGPTRL